MIKRIDPFSPIIKKKERELIEVQEVEFQEIKDDPLLDQLYSKKPEMPKHIEKSLREILDQIDKEYESSFTQPTDLIEELDPPKQATIDFYLDKMRKQEARHHYAKNLQNNLVKMETKTRSDYSKKK